MSTALDLFARCADWAGDPGRIAVEGPVGTLTYTALVTRVARRTLHLQQAGTRVLATCLDNGLEWLLMDLAALHAGVVHVPMPLFFTPAQRIAILAATGADTVMCDPRDSTGWPALGFAPTLSPSDDMACLRRATAPAPMPAGTRKVTFTSGSTGTPKGVCLDERAMLLVAQSLAHATATQGVIRHLQALPLPVLLENLAGMYAPLWAGATCLTGPLASMGLTGSSTFDPLVLHDAITRSQAQSVILLPQMLHGYAAWLAGTGRTSPPSLQLVAVGGARLGAGVLRAARAVGLPACEGYGLSEGASVQTLNLPGASRDGSVGRPLLHAQVRVAGDGEIEIAGSLFLGYLGSDTPTPAWLATGDLGRVDDDGYVWVEGRKKALLITAFGRNVSPEWVEAALLDQPVLAQAVVLGDGQPQLGAVVWPRAGVDDARIQTAIDHANASLPDYARIGPWCRAQAAFETSTGLATANGRPRRDAVAERHAAHLFGRDAVPAAYHLPVGAQEHS